MNFIPDSGKYEIVAYICTCVGDHVNTNTPLKRVAEEVVGWTVPSVTDAGNLTARELLPLHPVVLTLEGLRAVVIPSEDDMKIGSPRLASIGKAQMTHQELIFMHRTVHERD